MSEGVIITPQACVPVFLTDPSKMVALFMVSDSIPSPSEIVLSSLTISFSSDRRFSILLLLLSSVPKIVFSLILGTSFASLSASNNGKSKTLAVSRIEDLAAIVP
ncbi:MAG: Uncharacterised protein [Flavobacterium sp. SCGC AAA160-P02]|nr:MAG: Uncharacterised protein [Flavobacterium sp. SCGC AAA160-P02]